ncbi:MAG: heme-binding protein [Acidiferrobacterales bacterium]
MKRAALNFFVLFGGAVLVTQALAETVPYQRIRALNMEAANKVAMAAARDCSKKGYQVAVAVTDRYGNLLAFARSPLSGRHTIGVAQNKAYTAATLQGSTEVLGPQVKQLKGVHRISLSGGGLAIRAGGIMYGAVGVSGAPGKKTPGDVDDGCAKAGVKAILDELELAE